MRISAFAAPLFALLLPHAAPACELKLLLSWDVSASMSAAEFQIQRQGTADAFRDPTVQNAIALSRGGVAVAVMQWAGPEEQAVSAPWTLLRSGRDARAFADLIAGAPHAFGSYNGTAIGDSLRRSADYLAAGPAGCARTVLDISGDGVANSGLATAPEADALDRAGVTINGLVLPSKQVKNLADDPYMFYVRHVRRGPDSFVMDVASYEDFPRAMRRKLLRELLTEVALAETE